MLKALGCTQHCIDSTEDRQRREGHEFKVILSYIASFQLCKSLTKARKAGGRGGVETDLADQINTIFCYLKARITNFKKSLAQEGTIKPRSLCD